MHKRVIHKYQRRMIYSPGIDSIWTSDLIILNRKDYVNQNDGFKYILTVMDIFSKYAWVRVTKTKDKKTIADAFQDTMTKSKRQPSFLWSDGAGEFNNLYFHNMLKKRKIKWYTVQSELKAIMIERFNQTLMGKLIRTMTENNSYRYIDHIQQIVDKYNNTYHSSIKMSPIEASKPQNEGLVYYNLYNERRRKMLKQNRKIKFKINDHVRISRLKKTFQKGYDKRWSDEIFIIYKVNPTLPVTYKIKEILKNGENRYIRGNFYQEELQKTAFSEKIKRA